jgi:predicted nucleic-acid-binding protein
MIGLDTNVLLRLFVEDDPAQSERARRFVDVASASEPCLINPIVLAEFAWTLARSYRRKRSEVARLIEGVLSMDDLDIPYRRAAQGALLAYRSGKADYPDYFLAEINAELGCTSTATFDIAALDSPSFSPVTVSAP